MPRSMSLLQLDEMPPAIRAASRHDRVSGNGSPVAPDGCGRISQRRTAAEVELPHAWLKQHASLPCGCRTPRADEVVAQA